MSGIAADTENRHEAARSRCVCAHCPLTGALIAVLYFGMDPINPGRRKLLKATATAGGAVASAQLLLEAEAAKKLASQLTANTRGVVSVNNQLVVTAPKETVGD
ncbi:MAG: twin-arginine translocation signal domain-containing protein, partial [Pseudomonadota bacterium]|nr:twin-arginine translocation signal domain-containing protein [Pseudomonadota bacterium]